MVNIRNAWFVLTAFAACGATCGEGTSPVWHPQTEREVFCEAMAHSQDVRIAVAKRGALLTFVARAGQSEALLQALRKLAPSLMTLAPEPLPKHEERLDKWRPEQLKAHGGSHGGGSASSTAPGGAASGAGAGSGGAGGLPGGAAARRPLLVDVREHPDGGELLIVAVDASDAADLRAQLELHLAGLRGGACERSSAPVP